MGYISKPAVVMILFCPQHWYSSWLSLEMQANGEEINRLVEGENFKGNVTFIFYFILFFGDFIIK